MELGLSKGIENADRALSLCLSNKFNEAKDFLDLLDGSCFYHTVSKATISYLQAVLTYEPELITEAYAKVKEASIFCDRHRRKQSWSEAFQSLVYSSPSYTNFTEDELHAELCYAECLLEWALLTFIQDENLISFIKGGLKIKNAYDIYKNCMLALDQKPKSLESKNGVDFSSGVYMGVGTFNMLLSLLPARVLRLLEWVGFSGDKAQGMKWLHEGHMENGLRSALCACSLLAYQIVASPLLGIGDTDIEYSKNILDLYLKKFPDGAIFLYFSGRLKQTQGLLDEALKEYEKAVTANIDWQQVHHICYWEMMWCYCFKANWEKAAVYAELLSTESKWSKSSYLYLQASFLLMYQLEKRLSKCQDEQLSVEESKRLNEKISSVLENVAKYKQRIAGKSIPFEKFAVCRMEKYKSTGMLVLPGLELIHIWNGFTVLCMHPHTVNHLLTLIDAVLKELQQKEQSSKCDYDDKYLCLLLKGICLRHVDRFDEAEEILNKVAKSPASSHFNKMECYIPAYAAAEIGFMYHHLQRDEDAERQLNHTLKHYSKYGLESRLHFRIHSVIEVLKLKKATSKKAIVTEDRFEKQASSDFDVLSQQSALNDSFAKDDSLCCGKSNEDADSLMKNLEIKHLSSEESSTSLNRYGSRTSDVEETFSKLSSRSSDGPVSEAASSISPMSHPKNLANVVLSKETSL